MDARIDSLEGTVCRDTVLRGTGTGANPFKDATGLEVCRDAGTNMGSLGGVINSDGVGRSDGPLTVKSSRPSGALSPIKIGPPQSDLVLLRGAGMGLQSGKLLTDLVFRG